MSSSRRHLPTQQTSAFERARLRSLRRMSEASERHKVSFSTLTITEFSIRPCDNPACTEGPPIAIDRKLREKGPINIDLYEFAKNEKERKTQDDLRLSRYDRENCLKEHGYSRSEIEAAAALLKKEASEKTTKSKFSLFSKSKS
jgi:hypothetical protein